MRSVVHVSGAKAEARNCTRCYDTAELEELELPSLSKDTPQVRFSHIQILAIILHRLHYSFPLVC